MTKYTVGDTVKFFEYGFTGMEIVGIITKVIEDEFGVTFEVLSNSETWIVGEDCLLN